MKLDCTMLFPKIAHWTHDNVNVIKSENIKPQNWMIYIENRSILEKTNHDSVACEKKRPYGTSAKYNILSI